MRILVDADACPVKNIIEDVAKQYKIEVIMVSNHHHGITSSYAQILMVDSYSQSVDIAIVNIALAGDILVTQDYGLAAMVLEKGVEAIHPGGRIFTKDNIESLLMQRYVNQKARESRIKTTRTKKRTTQDDLRFRQEFINLIEGMVNEGDK
ncbi:hypothetical protein ASZ90_018503 [hydrocarbon metagenome]|uniref:Uncharacterized protein n=1 Tax=hydrocarbon metagenome TaxID=938273 RepID=A0A0W8E611_9ZZZZ